MMLRCVAIRSGVPSTEAVSMYRHALIIGGTGMLREASIAIARRAREITSIARTRRSLTALDAAFSAHTGTHHTLSLDWSDPENFLHAVKQHLAITEPPDLILAYLHDVRLTLRLTPLVSTGSSTCRFFHVIGSVTTDPLLVAASLLEQFEPLPNVLYYQVILGYRLSNGRSRWLTNAEISEGVLEAIEQQRNQSVVGAVRPWSSHP